MTIKKDLKHSKLLSVPKIKFIGFSSTEEEKTNKRINDVVMNNILTAERKQKNNSSLTPKS